MKRRIILSPWIIAALLLMPWSCVQAQQTGAQEWFKPFLGKWSAIMSYVHSGNQFTVSRSEDVQVKQLDPNTISFSMKPMVSEGPVFDAKLFYEPATKKCFLGVKTDGRETLEKTELTYEKGVGFSGKGNLRDIQEKTHAVEVKISFTPEGGHEWTIKDPAGPANNNEVFGFSFMKRLN